MRAQEGSPGGPRDRGWPTCVEGDDGVAMRWTSLDRRSMLRVYGACP